MGIVFLELLGVSITEGMSEESKKSYFKQLPPELSDIISGMTLHDPTLRYSSSTVLS